MNVGNRAVVAQRGDPDIKAGLVFHEVAHLVLCNDADSGNPGTMGLGTELDLTAREWGLFRGGLDNVRETPATTWCIADVYGRNS